VQTGLPKFINALGAGIPSPPPEFFRSLSFFGNKTYANIVVDLACFDSALANNIRCEDFVNVLSAMRNRFGRRPTLLPFVRH
jgi:hypothetical protein